jgi:hypothetical protein
MTSKTTKKIGKKRQARRPAGLPVISSRICQACARCCKHFHIFVEERDDALRFSRLKTRKIEVRELVKGKLWKVLFHYPCAELKRSRGTYRCAVYDQECTSYRKNYPYNFLEPGTPREILEDEKKTCPALKHM